MRILHVSSEAAPWSQTGGLGDVVGALPDAQVALGAEVAVVSPMYRGVAAKLGRELTESLTRVINVGPYLYPAALRVLRRPGAADHWFVDAPELYDREAIYGPGGGREYADNHVRFAALCRAAIDFGADMMGGPVDVVHAHDWQAGLAPVYLRLDPTRARTASVMTIHNLAYRGLFAKQVLPELGVPWSEFRLDGLEFYDQVSLLKGGLARADVVTTVSPSYAAEIVEPIAGEGLHAFLGALPRLVGIVNGIDAEAWNPATDVALPARFAAADPAGKAACRRALAEEYGLRLGPDTVLAVMVSRLADQKGCDIVADLVPELHGLDARLIVLGAGDATLEDRFRWLGRVFREHIAVHVGFDVARARRIYAGGDLFLMPSRFEPCGIGQLYAMRYGALPVVHAVGGLRDTVADGVTGFTFEFADLLGLRWGVERALATYRDDRADWRRMVGAAMSRDSSWAPSARRYMDEYRVAVAARR